MRLICVPNLTIFIFTIFTLSHITFAQDSVDQANLQNIDDTSLFRGVENTMDEEGDDADRILKSLQDTSADDFLEDDDQEEEVIHHSSSKDIKQRIQPDEGELEDDSDNEIDDDIDIEEEEEEEEEDDDDDQEDDDEEDYDFSADSFPDFRNEETAEFFDHLPQQVSNAENEKLSAEEDDDVDNNEEEDEEEENIVDNMNNEKTTNTNNNNNDIPIDTIPWHKSDPLEKAVIDDDKFYQEGNMNYGNEYSSSIIEFKLWHGMSVLLILAIIYKWVNKSKSNHILDNNNSSLSWSNRDEKDYLPLHNNNRHFKWEIKTS
ncbi:hypothetical protein BDF21DRAFT_450411 [Thamnidium elegans]|nr:hypothetical protein BDF21DRAFT_450411 [Thamnidium elegans]